VGVAASCRDDGGRARVGGPGPAGAFNLCPLRRADAV
jgi:hypothetical protein